MTGRLINESERYPVYSLADPNDPDEAEDGRQYDFTDEELADWEAVSSRWEAWQFRLFEMTDPDIRWLRANGVTDDLERLKPYSPRVKGDALIWETFLPWEEGRKATRTQVHEVPLTVTREDA